MKKILISIFTIAVVTGCKEAAAGSILSEGELKAIRGESCLIARTVPCGAIFGNGQPCPSVSQSPCSTFHCIFCDGLGDKEICDEPSETQCCKLISQGDGDCGPHREGSCAGVSVAGRWMCECINIIPIFGGCDRPDYQNQSPPC